MSCQWSDDCKEVANIGIDGLWFCAEHEQRWREVKSAPRGLLQSFALELAPLLSARSGKHRAAADAFEVAAAQARAIGGEDDG